MGTVNQIQVLLSLMTLNMILLGGLLNSFEKYLPSFILQLFRYGKFSYKGDPTFLRKIELPKSWFRHFYVYSSVLTCLTLILVLAVYIFNLPIPQIVFMILRFIDGDYSETHVSAISVLLAMTLLTMQCFRRLYDTRCVSVFSSTAKINLSHYIVGYLHYTIAVLAILVEAPKFAGSESNQSKFCWSDLTYLQMGAAVLFVWSWWHQYAVTVILANLRKNQKGKVVTEKYKLPHGDWFNYVSSPHNLSEILMYIALTIILWRNITWLYVLGWVLSNQIETALLTHWWYQEKFSNLPRERKAIIPFIY